MTQQDFPGSKTDREIIKTWIVTVHLVLTHLASEPCQLEFSRTYKIGNIAIFFQFPPLFAPSDVSKCRIRYQWGLEDKTSRLQTLLVLFFHNSIAKTKLAMLAFLYYIEFVKTSIDTLPFNIPSPYIFSRILRICHKYAFV